MRETDTCELHCWTGEAGNSASDLALPKAVMQADPNLALYGFAYTRASARLFRVDEDGQACSADGSLIDLAVSFEGRLFCRDWELRWLRQDDRRRLSLLTDVPGIAQALDEMSDEQFVLKKGKRAPLDVSWLENRYLLWGERRKSSSGWTTLTSARIGALEVPFELAAEERRIALTAHEYFECRDDGNWVFAGERLTGFVAVDRPRRGE